MPHPQSPYRAAWQLWRHSAGRRLRHAGPTLIRAAEVPIRARPSALRAPAVLTTPPAPRGLVILPRPAEMGRAADIARALQRVGLGTLELVALADSDGLEARAERLIEAARWLGREGRKEWRGVRRERAREAERMPPIGLVGLGADAAAVLVAAASGVVPIAAVVAAAGRYDGLDEGRLAGLRAPVRLIAARDDATGLWQARQVVGWLAAGAGHNVVAVPGAADITPAGWRQARWLAGAWLVDHLVVVDAAEVARDRSARRLRLARGGLSLLPLGALMASWWMAQPARPPGAQAASARLWTGVEWAGHTGGRLPVYRMDAASGTFELSSLSGTNGFRVNGISTSDHSGRAVSGAGDVNNDGFDDILIGTFLADPHGYDSGQSYVVYGGSGVPGTVELSALNGTNGFRINGISTSDRSGRSVSGAGDVNMDGFDDILIGADRADPHGSNSGQSYVVYGGTGVPATVDLSALNGTNGFRVNGISAGDYSGFSVSGAGDVNNDGFDDILIGADRADPHGYDSGQSYVVYGGSAVPGTVELSGLSGTNGFRINGISTGDHSGQSVSGAGDVNMDGFDDILIGAPSADPHGLFSGQSYVVYGGSGVPSTVDLAALNGTSGFRINGISTDDRSGRSVSGAGDVNMDGFDDILIGADRADPHGNNSGQSYVVYGGTGVPATVDLSVLNGTNGFRVNGISAGDYSGDPVSGAGDVNMDGFDDILIGASRADPHGTNSGQSYVVYGGSGVPGTVELSALNGTSGFRINGISTSDRSGYSVSNAGDVNSDGFDDILIGAYRADPNGNYSGQSYVVYGDGVVPPTSTPTATATNTPTNPPTATDTPTNTPTSTPTITPTNTPTATPTITPTNTPTPTQPRGDCNADNVVDGADVSGLVLEIFDGDGHDPVAVPGGTFSGDPTGCNANADAVVDAGDLSCMVRLIFGSGGGCGP